MTITSEMANGRSTATRSAPGRINRSAALAVAVIGALSLGTIRPAHAEDAELQALKKQVQELQQRLDALAARQAQAPSVATTPAPAAATASTGNAPVLHAGPVDVTLGGFVELMVVGRSKNEAADWASNWNTAIPFPQSQNSQVNDFRLTERQSRLSALATAPADDHVAAEAYIEADFGAGPRTGNNNESTSFSPRVRHFYADYKDKDANWYLLFGQAWSLMTQNKHGIEQRNELIPLTIDGQYVPGFTWSRAPQVRFVKNFGSSVAFGVSVENPATLVGGKGCNYGSSTAVAATAPFCGTAGGSGYDANNNITLDPGPDIQAKFAFDPGWGHYEVFGIQRSFRDRVNLSNQTTSATSFGGSVLLPLIDKKLDFMASGLTGDGVGRYGSAQLPDVTMGPGGKLAAIKGYSVLVGLTLKATPTLTLYAYGGREHDDQTSFAVVTGGNSYAGYGSPLADNSNCLVEGSSSKCDANTSSVTQETIGGWWKFYQGGLGNFQIGAQLTHVKRDTYAGVGPTTGVLTAPSTSMNVGELSFRFYPYQK